MTVKPRQPRLRRRLFGPIVRSLYDLRHAIDQTPLSPNGKSYVPFLILASPRTGSTLISRALDQHENAVCYGELMRNYDRFPDFLVLGNTGQLYRSDPAKFMDKRIYRNFPTRIGAAGFKIFYHHAPIGTEWGRAVWSYLTNKVGLRVIHLWRRNLLAVELSIRKAQMTREWIRYSSESQQTSPIPLDYKETRASFEKLEAAAAEREALFAGKPLLNLFYEDVADDFDAEMKRVQTFLDLSPFALAPTTRKRTRRPLAEQIVNYHELKDRFAGSRWAEFFED